MADIFDHLNEGAGNNDLANQTVELEKQLAMKKKMREQMKQ